MLTALWYFFFGYVIIKIDGLAIHRFMTECARCGVRLDEVRAVGAGVFTAKLTAAGFFKLRRIARQTNCRVRILEKHGAPFMFCSFADRPMLYLGALGFVCVLMIGSRCIWRVELNGGDTATREKVALAVRASGVYPFMKKSKLDLNALKNAIELCDHSVAWAGAQLEGGVLTLMIVERQELPSSKEGVPCDIVARKSALVHSVTPIKGTAAVVCGQAVSAGQTLISGFLSAKENAPDRYIQAKGSAMGIVHYTGSSVVPRYQSKLVPTGNSETVCTFDFCGQSIQVWASFESYTTSAQREYQLSDIFLPLTVTIQERDELALRLSRCSDEELSQTALRLACKNALDGIDKSARILSQTPAVYVSEDSAVARHVVRTLEDIAEIKTAKYYNTEATDGTED